MPLALSGATPVWGEFPGENRTQFIDGLTTFLLMAGWEMDTRIPATVQGVHDHNPVNNDSLTLAGITYTFLNTINNLIRYQVKIGTTQAITLSNFVAAVNGGAGAGTAYSTRTISNPLVSAATDGTTVTITFIFTGPVGNGTPTSYGKLINGGYKVLGKSAQQQGSSSDPITAKAHIYDRQFADGFGNKFAHVKLGTPDDAAVIPEKSINVKSTRRFRVVANRCQFFCYVPGLAGDQNGSVMAGGVPWVPPTTTCAGEVPSVLTDSAFWLSTDRDNVSAGAPATSPRTSAVLGTHYTVDEATQVTSTLGDATGWHASDAAFNGAVVAGGAGSETGVFRLCSMTPSKIGGGTLIDGVKWHGRNGRRGQPMLLEPLVAWAPSAATQPPMVRGQIYDAWFKTAPVAMDTVELFADSRYYVAMTNVAKFATLWLYVPGPTPIQFEFLQASYAH